MTTTSNQIEELLHYLDVITSSTRLHSGFKHNRYIKLKNKGYIIAYTGNIKFYLSKEDEYLLQFRCFGVNSKSLPYLKCVIKGRRYFLHNLIMRPPEGYEVDHINGNVLDNRRGNLRLVTHSQNCKNKKQYTNSSYHMGVSYRKDRPSKPWCSQIIVDGKRIGLGQYKTKEEALQVRLEAEKKYYGEYRRREDNE